MNKFTWLKTYFSPFKSIIPKLYIGKVAIGTPYFFPRKWVKDKDNPGCLKAASKKIGLDFVDLGWKTKWSNDDFRHEWSPIWSFVFFGYQIALMFVPIHSSYYWECWLYYELRTDKTKTTKERLKEAKEGFPCRWIIYSKNGEVKICYWDLILKDKHLKNDNI